MFKFNTIKITAAALCAIIVSSLAVVAGPTNYEDTLKMSGASNNAIQHNQELVFINDVNHINIKEISLYNPTLDEIVVHVQQTLKNPFSYKGKYEVRIPAMSEQKLPFKFHPSFKGKYTASVNLVNKSHNSRSTLHLTGYTSDSVPFPISVSNEKIDFENQVQGSTATENLSIQNLSNEEQTVQIQSSNSLFSTPEIVTIAALDTQQVAINLNTNTTGQYNGQLDISLIQEDETLSETKFIVELNAKVIAQPAIKQANFEISNKNLNFQTQVGIETMKVIKIKNTGNTELKLALETENPEVNVTYPKTLQANETKSIKVTFAPSYNRTENSKLNFLHNAAADKELAINLNLVSYGGEKQQSKTKIKFDKKIYKATRNNRGTFKLNSNHPALINVQIKKDGMVVKNLGIYELEANQDKTIYWNGRDERNSLVTNDTYMLVAQGMNSEDNFTHSAQIKTNFGKPKYQTTNKIANVVYQNKKYYKNFSQNIHLASLETVCQGRVYINITIYDINTDYKLKVPHQQCQQLLHLQIPDFLNEGQYRYKIELRQKHLVQNINGSLNIINVNNTVSNIHFDTNQEVQAGAFEASLSQNIANTEQDLYVSFQNYKHGYVNAKISGKNLNKDLHIARFQPFASGEHRNALKVKKQSLKPGIYTLELDLLQDNVKLTKSIEFIIIEQTPQSQTYGFFDTFGNQDCGEYSDINQNDNFCKKIQFANQQNLVSQNSEYKPNQNLKRAEAAALTIRLLGVQPRGYSKVLDSNLGYSDLNINAWYMPYMKMIIKSNTVNQAENSDFVRRILQGYPDQTMRPENSINRAEFYKIFFEAAKNSKMVTLNLNIDYNTEVAPFKDTPINKDTRWYLPYAEIVKNNLSGTDFARLYFKSQDLNNSFAKFQPYKKITRKEVIDLIYTLAELNLINF